MNNGAEVLLGIKVTLHCKGRLYNHVSLSPNTSCGLINCSIDSVVFPNEKIWRKRKNIWEFYYDKLIAIIIKTTKLAHNLRVQSVMVRKPWQQKHESAAFQSGSEKNGGALLPASLF